MPETYKKLKQEQIFIKLIKEYDLKDIKYDVFSKTFVFMYEDQEDVNITFDTLLRDMSKDTEIYNTLDLLRSTYFPRRLKEIINSFYDYYKIKKPKQLYINREGFKITHNGEVHFVPYEDDFDIFLEKFAQIYDVEYKDFCIAPKPENYTGNYHRNE